MQSHYSPPHIFHNTEYIKSETISQKGNAAFMREQSSLKPASFITTFRAYFTVFMLLFILQCAMNKGISQNCGTGSFFQWDTIDWVGRGQKIPPIRFIDNTGHEYDSTTLPSPNALVGSCTVGMFNILFDDAINLPPFFNDAHIITSLNPNLNGLSMGEIRRNLVCQVFRDISSMLFDVNPNGAGRVNIQVSGNGGIGIMTTHNVFVLPNLSLPNNAVLDPESYKTIVSGVNSFTQYPTALWAAGDMIHAYISIDRTIDWHYDLSIPPTASPDPVIGDRNFYTVFLHEILHSLGLSSVTPATTNPSCFTRYQRFLSYNNQQDYIIQNPANSGNWVTTPNVTPNNCGDPGMLRFQTSTGISQEAFDAGGHLSCVNGPICPNGYGLPNDFTMIYCSGFGPNFLKMNPNEIEKDILCTLGYSLNTNVNGQCVYGQNQPYQHIYQNTCTPPCAIISQPETFCTSASTPLTIFPLENDINSNGGLLTQLVNFTSNAGTVSAQTNTSFIFTPNTNFSGWAILTYVPECANGQMGGTNFIFIYVAGCNLPNSPIPYSIGVQGQTTSWSSLGLNLVADVPILINGTLQIDDNLSIFPNTNIIMGVGASIEIMPNNTLTLGDMTVIHSCSDMWDGIRVFPNASLTANNVLIEDAENAVQGFANSTISIKNSRFHKNNVALWLPDQGGTSPLPNSLNLTFSNNLMDCTNAQLLFPHPAGTISRTGILARNFEIQLGTENHFEDMRNGIIADDCNLNVPNCYFNHIRHPQFPTTGEGIAILARNSTSFSRETNVLGFGKHGVTNFDDCRIGILNVGEYLSMLAQDNHMENVDYGIRTRRNILAHHVHSLFNYIECHRTGIEYLHEDGVLESQINFNEIEVNATIKSAIGIAIYDNLYTSFPPPPHQITLNEVRLINGVDSKGVQVSYAQKSQILENLVTIHHANVWSGISLSKTDYAQVQCNTVNTNGINANNGNASYGTPIALQLAASKGGTYTCNYLYDTYTGIRFENDCSATELKGNEMHDHHIGLHYNAVGISGNQGTGTQRNGNKWLGNFGVAAKHEDNSALGTFISNSLFNVNSLASPFTPQSLAYAGGSFSPSTQPSLPVIWFKATGGTTYQCNPNSVCNSFAQRTANDSIENIDYLIATGQYTSAIYEAELKWQAERSLYQKLLADSTLQQDSIMQNFMERVQDSSQSEYQDFQRLRTDELALSPLDSTTLINLSNQIAILTDSLRQTPINEDSTLQNQRQQIFIVLASTQNLYNAAIQGINALRDSVSAFLQTQNGLLPSQRLYEENERIVNEIYFSTLAIGIDSFTVSQLSDLYTIANQCPLAGGDGVYYARSILRLIDDSTDYDDKELCFAQGINYRQASNQPKHLEDWVIYPNPANNILHIQSPQPTLGEIKLVWINTLGTIVSTQSISLNGREQEINISSLPNGIYHLHVYEEGRSSWIQKVVIVH